MTKDELDEIRRRCEEAEPDWGLPEVGITTETVFSLLDEVERLRRFCLMTERCLSYAATWLEAGESPVAELIRSSLGEIRRARVSPGECLICGKVMHADQNRDDDDLDCGGDCAGCIRELESVIQGPHQPPLPNPHVTEAMREKFDGVEVHQPNTSTVNRVRTPHDDVVDAWWKSHVGDWSTEIHRKHVLAELAEQPEAVQRGVLRKARGQ